MGIVGSIVGGIFGSKASNDAANQAAQNAATNNAFAQHMYDANKELISPEIANSNLAQNSINGILGLGSAADTAAGSSGLNAYKDTSGYQFLMDQGLGAVNANAAAKGAFQSGATAKALTNYATGLADQTQNNYLTQLTNVANRGTSEKNALMGQGTQLVTQTTANNNGASTAAQQNSINQGNIISGTLSNIGSSFGGGGGGILGSLFGI